jgi:long-chain acyl-CoA synthetase
MLAGRVAESFRERGASPAIIAEGGGVTTYEDLHGEILGWCERLGPSGILSGDVVALEGGYSPELLACFWALARNGNIVMPLTPQGLPLDEARQNLAEVRHHLAFDAAGGLRHKRRNAAHSNPLLKTLRDKGESGLILFSSGTEGSPKIVLHDLGKLLGKYQRPLRAMRTLLFLVFDHIAGLDTLFYTLCAGGCCVLENTRRPELVCKAIALHSVEVLAATPSFLGLLLASEAHQHHDLSCLKVVAYGSEPMPPHILSRLGQALPQARLVQRYGTTELGSPASRSRDRETLWMQIDGDQVRSKVVDGVLLIKADTAMLGYLNGPSPFDAEGWLNTGDVVEVDGPWIRVLGRRSAMINVGGEKVHPPEVENVLLQMPNVASASVRGEGNALLGQIVVAELTLREPQSLAELKRDVREFCRGRLAPHQVPARILLAQVPPHSYRFKKTRDAAG